jgi:hypothetical protein
MGRQRQGARETERQELKRQRDREKETGPRDSNLWLGVQVGHHLTEEQIHGDRWLSMQRDRFTDIKTCRTDVSVSQSVCLSVYQSVSIERQKQEEPVLLLLIFCQIHKIGLAQTLIILSDVKK